jgi:hypothetical protein
MSRLENLPLDVIREIIGPHTKLFQAKADLCSLRLVSKCLDALVYPTLFCSLNLDFKDPLVTNRCQNIITMLADGSTTVFEYTQHLKFDASRVYDEMQELLHVQKVVGERIFLH